MDIEGNLELPGVDKEGQEAPKIVEIEFIGIPPDPQQIETETATQATFEVPAAP